MTASADQLSKLLDEKTRKDFPAISVAIGRADRLIWQSPRDMLTSATA